ncbi:MAG: hypothetical protein KatS3mg060_1787 [Dehalococcoidia bacterium]|nr:MAG: hypothetical protein KatS3mg060_1787 [Dehalococcoidia bacterium]
MVDVGNGAVMSDPEHAAMPFVRVSIAHHVACEQITESGQRRTGPTRANATTSPRSDPPPPTTRLPADPPAPRAG